METNDTIKSLLELNVSAHTKKKDGMTYLTWSKAWEEFLKVCPSATYEVVLDENNKCYFGDELAGYMVYTNVTVDEITKMMWLPIMNGANKAMKLAEYTYKVKEWKDRKWTGGYLDKKVEPFTMFDVNKAIMRCLVKNLAMFGLGLNVYTGEDLPSLMPTGIPCKDLIEVGYTKGYSSKKVEEVLIGFYGHGMEYVTQIEHDEALRQLGDLKDKLLEK